MHVLHHEENNISVHMSSPNSVQPVKVRHPPQCNVINTNSFNDSGRTIIEKDIALCAITESWLKPDDDVIGGLLQPNGYRMLPICRYHKKGGGIAVVHKESLKAKVSSAGQFNFLPVYGDDDS